MAAHHAGFDGYRAAPGLSFRFPLVSDCTERSPSCLHQIATAPLMVDSAPGKEDTGPVYDFVDEERAPLAGDEEDGEWAFDLAFLPPAADLDLE